VVVYPKNFTREEFLCKHTGREGIRQELVDTLQAIRTAFGAPITVTSGYRDPSHPAERNKPKGSYSAHVEGVAADIAIPPGQTERLYALILARPEVKGVGYSAESNFFHLDLRKTQKRIFWKYRAGVPTVWNGKLQ
jgi:uncharacterized protein YcbK (DUF882 family)